MFSYLSSPFSFPAHAPRGSKTAARIARGMKRLESLADLGNAGGIQEKCGQRRNLTRWWLTTQAAIRWFRIAY